MALSPYKCDSYPKTCEEFGSRLKEIEVLRRKAAEIAMDEGECNSVFVSELSLSRSTLNHLHFWVDCETPKNHRVTMDEFEIKTKKRVVVEASKNNTKPPKLPAIDVPVSPAKDNTEEADIVYFPKPSWCPNAKTEAQNITCQNEDTAREAINLDDEWDTYKTLHNDQDINKMRQYLRDWNKKNQSCNDIDCIKNAHKEAIQKLTAANKLVENQKSAYPFVGTKAFNFFGGTGTGLTITIGLQGKAKVRAYNYQGIPNTEWEGLYKDMPYKIVNNKIYELEKNQTIKQCEAIAEPENTCVSELY